MFTGIVEGKGLVKAVERLAESARITINGGNPVLGVTRGQSIAVNGCCLTAVEIDGVTFTADVMNETLKRTNLGALIVDDEVNIERPMRADGRFDGHIVQGHVDGVGTITKRQPGDRWELVSIEIENLGRYLVEKGSVTVDGVSLTLVSVDDIDDQRAVFTVSLIPETLSVTTLGSRPVGSRVNIEVDILAKYVERMQQKERA